MVGDYPRPLRFVVSDLRMVKCYIPSSSPQPRLTVPKEVDHVLRADLFSSLQLPEAIKPVRLNPGISSFKETDDILHGHILLITSQ